MHRQGRMLDSDAKSCVQEKKREYSDYNFPFPFLFSTNKNGASWRRKSRNATSGPRDDSVIWQAIDCQWQGSRQGVGRPRGDIPSITWRFTQRWKSKPSRLGKRRTIKFRTFWHPRCWSCRGFFNKQENEKHGQSDTSQGGEGYVGSLAPGGTFKGGGKMRKNQQKGHQFWQIFHHRGAVKWKWKNKKKMGKGGILTFENFPPVGDGATKSQSGTLSSKT